MSKPPPASLTITHIGPLTVSRGILPEYGILLGLFWWTLLTLATGYRQGEGTSFEFPSLVGAAFLLGNVIVAPFFWQAVTPHDPNRVALPAPLAWCLFWSLAAGGGIALWRFSDDWLVAYGFTTLVATHTALLLTTFYAVRFCSIFRCAWITFCSLLISVATTVVFFQKWPLEAHLTFVAGCQVFSCILIGVEGYRKRASLEVGADHVASLLLRPLPGIVNICFVVPVVLTIWLNWTFGKNSDFFEHRDISVAAGFLAMLPGTWLTNRFFSNRLSRSVANMIDIVGRDATLRAIRDCRNGIWISLKEGILNVFVVQTVFALGMISLFAFRGDEAPGGVILQARLFGSVALGASLMTAYLFVLKALMIFGERRAAVTAGVVFALCVLVFGSIAMFYRESALGWGMVIGSIFGALPGWFQLRRTVEDLDYRLFRSWDFRAEPESS